MREPSYHILYEMKYLNGIIVFGLLMVSSCEDESEPGNLALLFVRIGNTDLSAKTMTSGVAYNKPVILKFSSPVNQVSAEGNITLSRDRQNLPIVFSFADNNAAVIIEPVSGLPPNSAYLLTIGNQVTGVAGERFSGATYSFATSPGNLRVLEWTLGARSALTGATQDAPLDIDLTIVFGEPLDQETVNATSVSLSGPSTPALVFQFSADGKQLNITSTNKLRDLSKYTLSITDDLKGEGQETFTGFQIEFYTEKDLEPDFPVLADDQLLNLIQEQTFRYFWNFAHPASGMARERDTSGDLVTTGGTGFGIMALIVGMERNFISRQQGLERMEKILTFLESADRFHGAWPHWINGNTGDVIPFSVNDNGGDLVETSFLMQGLLTFRQYLDATITSEKTLVDRINILWAGVEWNWYTQGGKNVLYWHWSPDKHWTMNHAIRGYNEALITYFLAAASPTNAIEAPVYHEGWAGSGSIRNNKMFYNITLPVGPDYGGPLFFSHYSFLGLDPRNLQDTYASYWTQNVNHTLINRAHSAANPKGFFGHSDENWGLTSSDNQQGYSAHSPTNDLGVIAPTAALSSFPYTPTESMKALKFFYYTLGDRLWGPYGFYDAFNLTAGWRADSYLAIDQGPIIVMIENHRTGLLWNLFMSSPEVPVAMGKLGFTR